MPARSARRLALASLASLAVISCSGDSGETGRSAAPPPGAGEGPGVSVLGEGIDPDPLQTEILADGEVTPAEMERALLAVVACVDSEGYDAELDNFSTNGYDFFVAAEDGDTDAPARALDTCQARFLSEISEPFRLQHGPSQQEVDASHDAIRQCLLEKGYAVEGLSNVEMNQAVDVGDLVDCEDAGPEAPSG